MATIKEFIEEIKAHTATTDRLTESLRRGTDLQIENTRLKNENAALRADTQGTREDEMETVERYESNDTIDSDDEGPAEDARDAMIARRRAGYTQRRAISTKSEKSAPADVQSSAGHDAGDADGESADDARSSMIERRQRKP